MIQRRKDFFLFNCYLPDFMQLFYEPDFNEERNYLNEEESRHCVKVLRHSPGDVIHITNGMGKQFEVTITIADPKKCEVEIIKTITDPEKSYYIHICIAPTKNNDRLEWFVEKCTEIGIDEITPVFCQYSDRHKLRLDRLDKKAVSAMKQSLKNKLPKINPPVKLKEWLNKADIATEKFIAHYHPDNKSLLKEAHTKKSYVVLVGPEGDFSEEELHLSIDRGFKPVNLGNSRLRTETAALVACHTLNLINQE